jgi:hypothetical protein
MQEGVLYTYHLPQPLWVWQSCVEKEINMVRIQMIYFFLFKHCYLLFLIHIHADTVGYGPHNLGYVYLGTALLWFGWIGFNGGSALAANERAGYAVVATHLAACFGGFTWCVGMRGRGYTSKR